MYLCIAMGQCSASVLPNVSGVELKAYNFYTRDTVSMLLDSTDNGITWVQRDRDLDVLLPCERTRSPSKGK